MSQRIDYYFLALRQYQEISHNIIRLAFPFNFRFKIYLQAPFAHALFPDSQRGFARCNDELLIKAGGKYKIDKIVFLVVRARI